MASMISKAIFPLILGAGVALADITPTRIGPVSEYGELIAGKNSAGKGQIYGSCKGVTDGAEVQVRGMSLYWSLKPEAVEFWSAAGISSMVSDMNIQIVRAAMAAGTDDWGNGYKGYQSDPTTQKNLVSRVVEAAIAQDIYVIIDWHSHNAHEQTSSAVQFFSEMAALYGEYDNVIFEVYNEPMQIEWSTVKTYANQVIAAIREYSDNLIIVGNPSWDQNPQNAIGDEVTDSKSNVAYSLHYYANSHCWSGTNDWGGDCEGTKGLQAMNAGLSVFVSEWGTGDANGGGTPDVSRNTSWQNYLDAHKLSWANWSASKISEGTAAFSSGATASSLQYTTSGNLVKGYLASNPTSYTACSADTGAGISPSVIRSRSLKVSFADNALNISSKGNVSVAVYDLRGSRVFSAQNVTGTLSLKSLPKGLYVAKVRGASEHVERTFQIR